MNESEFHTTRIATAVVHVDGRVLGEWAITPDLSGDFDGYRLTHTPTGIAVPLRDMKEETCEDAARVCHALGPCFEGRPFGVRPRGDHPDIARVRAALANAGLLGSW